MDCRTFRENHAQFLDGLVGDEELVVMQRHVAECVSCAGHDATIRRALLLFRNMPSIEPSPEFTGRLQARLRAERREQRARAQTAGYGGSRRVRTFAAMGAGLLAAGLAVFGVLSRHTPGGPLLTLSPTVIFAAAPMAVVPQHRAERTRTIVGAGAPVLVRDSELPRMNDVDPWSSLTDPAFAASVSAGMPVWPAAVLAAHAPLGVGSPMKLTNLSR